MNERLRAVWQPAAARLRMRWPWLCLLLLVAVCYYGSYVQHGLNFKDEGGTEALVAKRLLEGERPFLEVVLGYNVLWFYPIVGLFKLFGVNFVLLRGYCFALSTLTAALAFLTVARAGRRPWLAFLVALLPLLVPGMTFKNYMPLLAVANAWGLVHFALATRAEQARRSWGWLAVGGLVLGLTFLIRIDVGLFCAVLWVGACLLSPGARVGSCTRRLGQLAGGPVLLLSVAGLLHWPVYLDAQHRGFAHLFIGQYLAWPQSLGQKLQQIGGETKSASLPAPRPAATPATAVPATGKAPAGKGKGTLARLTWRDFVEADSGQERLLFLLLYAPILSAAGLALIAAWRLVRALFAQDGEAYAAALAALLALGAGLALIAAWQLVRALFAQDGEAYAAALAALLALGAGLTTFPQYFFFRPDSPHLSEFSPGFWVGVASATLLLWRAGSWFWRCVAGFLVVHAGVYLWRMLPDRWTGTIAVRKSRTYRFRGENGVNVLVTRRESEGLKEIQRIVRTASQPGEYLVAYPYHPVVNVLADRPTYEKNVYIDNATSRVQWDAEAIARFQKFRPAVIVLSDWDVNGTDESRFSVWATRAKSWIQENYVYQGTYLDMELYTRPTPP